jgi:hypothetical protein
LELLLLLATCRGLLMKILRARLGWRLLLLKRWLDLLGPLRLLL